jgi:hypothetical protein
MVALMIVCTNECANHHAEPERRSARIALAPKASYNTESHQLSPLITVPTADADPVENDDPSTSAETADPTSGSENDGDSSATHGDNHSETDSEHSVDEDDDEDGELCALEDVCVLNAESFIIYKIERDLYYMLGQVLFVDPHHKPETIVAVWRYGLVTSTDNSWEKKRNADGPCEDWVCCREVVKWNFPLIGGSLPADDLRYFPRLKKK